ncbi:MAG TPA: mechanosensitive ion channel domain-containing protein [Bryobacteraceae bacterium]|nr:mechanosensitive ion channel domain-containing protein [Bryobacteraceae bacterium]
MPKHLKALLSVAVVLLVLFSLGLWFSPNKLPGFLNLLDVRTREFVTTPLFTLGKLPVTFIFLLKAFIFLAVLTIVSNRVRRILYSGVLKHTALDAQQRYTLARFGSLAVFVIGLIVGLESAGLNLNTLAILGGTLGIGVGFGLQSIVANWVSGLVLLVEQPVRIGDRVDVKNTSGVIIKIGGRSTWVRTYNNEVIIVPNSDFTGNLVTNWTANDPKVRLAIPVGVGYNSDPNEVRRTLLEIAKTHPDVLAEPAPEVVFTELGDSSLNFMLRFWTIVRDRDNYGLKSDLYFSIFEAFRRKGIEMPFTQRDLHLRSADVPLVISTAAASFLTNSPANDKLGDGTDHVGTMS